MIRSGPFAATALLVFFTAPAALGQTIKLDFNGVTVTNTLAADILDEDRTTVSAGGSPCGDSCDLVETNSLPRSVYGGSDNGDSRNVYCYDTCDDVRPDGCCEGDPCCREWLWS